MFVTKVPGHSKALQLHTLRQSNIQVPSSEPSNSVLGFGALILGQTGGHLAGGILDRTSLPLVQHRPTRRTSGCGIQLQLTSRPPRTILGNTSAWAIA